MNTINPIYPGATIGVLGSGQLGRMFALVARRMGYRVHSFSPDSDTPTGQVADYEHVASYEDLDALREFTRNVSVVTFEFENVPFATAQAISEWVPVRPGGSVLHTTQNRLRERSFLSERKLPHAQYVPVNSLDELTNGLKKIGAPAILKTAGFGYDGKGQWRIDATSALDQIWSETGDQPLILENRIDFEREISVIGVRGLDGSFVHYGPVHNTHKAGILDVTVAPTRDLPFSLIKEAVEMTQFIMEELDAVGVLCVEMFVSREGELSINELAPRPHNSGHYSIEACITNQFEQQLRAVCGLPLGSTEMVWKAAAMANLLGDLWAGKGPDWTPVLQSSTVKLHLYGKDEARLGRKMGHLTALADTPEEADTMVRSVRAALLAPERLNPVDVAPELRLFSEAQKGGSS